MTILETESLFCSKPMPRWTLPITFNHYTLGAWLNSDFFQQKRMIFVLRQRIKSWMAHLVKVGDFSVWLIPEKFKIISLIFRHTNSVCQMNKMNIYNLSIVTFKQGVSCDHFLRRTNKPRTSRSRFARTHARTPILWWSHFAPAPL